MQTCNFCRNKFKVRLNWRNYFRTELAAKPLFQCESARSALRIFRERQYYVYLTISEQIFWWKYFVIRKLLYICSVFRFNVFEL